MQQRRDGNAVQRQLTFNIWAKPYLNFTDGHRFIIYGKHVFEQPARIRAMKSGRCRSCICSCTLHGSAVRHPISCTSPSPQRPAAESSTCSAGFAILPPKRHRPVYLTSHPMDALDAGETHGSGRCALHAGRVGVAAASGLDCATAQIALPRPLTTKLTSF